ncbi:hypothetical protein, partial [Gallibacterium anatis]|uniref:hypothetical protein n=1 Tax=Gallibacterium anatis TaxID=750 RepID=UPI003003D9A5
AVAIKMGASLKILRLPLREMKNSKLSGVCFFCLLCFAQAKTTLRVERCFSNGTKCKAQPQ